jgi:hypothetical protein
LKIYPYATFGSYEDSIIRLESIAAIAGIMGMSQEDDGPDKNTGLI